MTRTIFIGDIHGCFDEFMLLLKKIKYNPSKDKLYLTGDIINKGPKSFEVLNFLIDNPQIKCVLGNNEVNFLRFLDGNMEKYRPVFDIYKKIFSNKHIEYLRNLPLYIETDKWILLHAGLVPGKNIDEHTIDEITRIREYNGKPWYEFYEGKKTIIYGHWAANGLCFTKNTKGLDTGCVYGKRLTAFIWETNEVFQQSALKQRIEI